MASSHVNTAILGFGQWRQSFCHRLARTVNRLASELREADEIPRRWRNMDATVAATLLWRATVIALVVILPSTSIRADQPTRPVMHVEMTSDFEISGEGDAAAWNRTKWTDLKKRPGGNHNYDARVKMLYSKKGLYFLMEGTDRILTATKQDDFQKLWTEDVFEFFLWTDERYPIYFEYEISPLNKELPIIIPNLGGRFFGWRPWQYDGDRRTKKAVSILSGPQQSGATIQGWRAEVFVPYDLLKPLQNVPPNPGTQWRANFYRVDYDGGKSTAWDWARVGPSFHDYKHFGTLVFE